MLLILSCTFRLGYDTSIVASKVGRIMSYNFFSTAQAVL